MYMIEGFVGSVANAIGLFPVALVTWKVIPLSVDRQASLPPRNAPVRIRPLVEGSGYTVNSHSRGSVAIGILCQALPGVNRRQAPEPQVANQSCSGAAAETCTPM